MTEWKDAFWLTKNEVKRSYISYLIIFGILILSIFFTSYLIDDYFAAPTIGLDIVFLLVFTTVLYALQIHLTANKIAFNRYVSPYIMRLNHLPIKKEVIVKHRFLMFIFLSVPFQVLFLLGVYLSSVTVQDKMSLNTFIVFAFIWLCFSIYIGAGPITYSVGTRIINWMLFGLVLYIGFIAYIILFFKVYTFGLINWTIGVATNYPILSIVISGGLAIIGWYFWQWVMLKKMKRFDYL